MTPMCENEMRYGYCLDPNCWSCAQYAEEMDANSDRVPRWVTVIMIFGTFSVTMWLAFKLLSQL